MIRLIWHCVERALIRQFARALRVSKTINPRYALPLVAACALAQTPLPPAYIRGVKDAQRVDARKISRNLIAITPYEKGLQWRGDFSGRPMVKVATWIGQSTPAKMPPYRLGPITTPPGYDDDTLIWVTAVPELQAFCSGYRHQRRYDLVLRMQQVLGMPPLPVYASWVVEFWVSPDDLLRPTPDPEVTDHEAELDFPSSSELVKIDADYKEWFIRHKNTVYTRDTPGTWTRLGYTYDWGSPANPVGLSEFIIRPQANVEVASIQTTAQYCH
jgi:hypothetical protein